MTQLKECYNKNCHELIPLETPKGRKRTKQEYNKIKYHNEKCRIEGQTAALMKNKKFFKPVTPIDEIRLKTKNATDIFLTLPVVRP
jgi:hypothetical protein